MAGMICPKCGGAMTTGFLLDVGQSQKATEWVEGEPKKSVWTGIKLSGLRRYPVNADRCNKCGFLELYA
jgi:predicted nucleic-acid-binding Zn-ribbon protein